jgi:DNA polymerase elongation subunit (family B)
MSEPAFVNGFVSGSDLVLLYRDDKGVLRQRRRPAEWSSFHRTKDMRSRPEVVRDLRNSRYVLGITEEGPWTRVRYQAPEWRKALCDPGSYFDDAGIECFEADVSEIRRFFADTGALIARPRRVFLDIETDSRVTPALARRGKARVLCWALVDEACNVVAAQALDDETDAAEVVLLEALFAALAPYDQVVAWFGDGFDFPVVKTRAEHLGAKTKDPRGWLWMDYLELYERANRQTAESGEEKESLKLQDVLMARIGHGKQEFDASKTYEAWLAGGAERKRLLEYCIGDSRGLAELEIETGYLALNDSICEVGRIFANTESIAPISYVDGFLLRMGVERGMHFPTRKRWAGGDKKNFQGAFVVSPQKTGIVKDVHCIDFSGMYPSIILTWNMSPETRAEVPVNGPIPPGFCRSPATRHGFRLGVAGVLPDALKEVRRLRKHWSKLAASLPPGTPEWQDAFRKATAYKVIANTFYGVIGSPFSRYFDIAVAESTTQNGVWLIQMTMHDAKGRGFFVVYGDTDSSMMTGGSREQIAKFVEHCNTELYPPAIAAQGCTENFIEIAYEKEFERVIWPVDDKGEPSAKSYTGVYRHYKGIATCACDVVKKEGQPPEPGALDVWSMTCKDCGKKWDELPPSRGKPEVRGLAYKRGDTTRLARQLQWEVIAKLCIDKCEEPEAFVPIVERYRKHILEEPLPLVEVAQSQSLSKPLKEYVAKAKKDGELAASPAHVRVARILSERGELVGEGTRISYIVLDSTAAPQKVIPAADYDGTCDRFYMWEDRVYPPTMRLLRGAFPNFDWRAFWDVRPKKVKPKAGGPAEGQAGLFAAPPASGVPAAPRKGVRKRPSTQGGLFAETPAAPGFAPLRPDEPFVVDLEERDLANVQEALARHPGERPVELRVHTRVGIAKLGRGIKVCYSAELIADVERAKASSAA